MSLIDIAAILFFMMFCTLMICWCVEYEAKRILNAIKEKK